MDNDNQDIKQSAVVSADEPQQTTHGRSSWLLVAAVVGMIFTIVAWIVLMFHPAVSLGCAIAGVALSVASLWMGPGCWRNIAITSVVASGVLILVHVVFTWVLDYALASL